MTSYFIAPHPPHAQWHRAGSLKRAIAGTQQRTQGCLPTPSPKHPSSLASRSCEAFPSTFNSFLFERNWTTKQNKEDGNPMTVTYTYHRHYHYTTVLTEIIYPSLQWFNIYLVLLCTKHCAKHCCNWSKQTLHHSTKKWWVMKRTCALDSKGSEVWAQLCRVTHLPRFLGTVLVLATKVLYPGKPFHSRQSKTIGHATTTTLDDSADSG